MRKKLQIIFPILLIASLLMVGVRTTNATAANWGINTGDSYDFTVGWNYGLTLPDSMWNELSSMATASFDAAYNSSQTIDLKQAYSDLNTLPHIFQMRAIVGNMVTVGDMDTFNSTIQMKLTNDTAFMGVGPFLNHVMTVYNSTLQKYSSLLDTMTNTTGALDFLASAFDNSSMFPAVTNLPTIWNATDVLLLDNMFSLFVPTDFNFNSIINVTEINDYMNQSFWTFEYNDTSASYDNVSYPSQWAYLQEHIGLPSSVNDVNSLLAAFGVTTFDVQNKSILIKYNFADMNQDMLNFMINASLGDMGVSTITQFMTFISTETNMNITLPTITSMEGITYNSTGVLQNAHSEFDFATTVNGSTVEFNPVFDISSGIHTSINANWNPSGTSIPGYPIWVISLASIVGIAAVVLTMKKKKR